MAWTRLAEVSNDASPAPCAQHLSMAEGRLHPLVAYVAPAARAEHGPSSNGNEGAK